MSSHEELRLIALGEFARAGYSATSLQRIAEIAGLSKSSVLYHFDSKEALLEAALTPALNEMEQIITPLESMVLTDDGKREFIVSFVDFLLAHRREVHMFINQGRFLEDVPVFERANQVVVRMANFFSSAADSIEDQMRFGVALAGAAYSLVGAESLDLAALPADETRAALITIITELLAPVSAHTLIL